MKIVLDVENTITERDGSKFLDPYEPTNQLVMVGIYTEDGTEHIVTFDHNEVPPTDGGISIVQSLLDQTDLLIAHNAVHDLTWLWETGFKYDGKIYDTMLAQYVLNCGIKSPLSLKALSEQYQLDDKKQDTMSEYLKSGVSVADIPHDELSEYLSYDLKSTWQLYNTLAGKVESSNLVSVVDLTNDVARVLAQINLVGFQVDTDVLEQVRHEFETEKQQLQKYLDDYVRNCMGDTPINLNSPEQLSQVIYSRKLLDKKLWAEGLDPYMDKRDFKYYVEAHTATVYKTRAEKCGKCDTKGRVRKYKKDGTSFKKDNICKDCNGRGYIYVDTNEKAGLKFSVMNPKWATANGFSTSKDNLQSLAVMAKSKGMVEQEKFLLSMIRINALDSYLSTFVNGIKRGVRNGLLHVKLNQITTSTGRFSGSEPNMQNMPRGGTFPVKKVFVSRWSGGKIMEADFAQLEFRVAAFLSQDNTAIEEVKTGFDVHSYTAKVITDAGQTTSRQEAKAHTFAPLYGATGFGRTAAEAAYYQHFTEKYSGVARWHSRLASEAISTGYITIPSGRKFSFPDVRRRANGSVTNFTNIKNYPVQSFATADIVPLVLVNMHTEMKSRNMKSVIVNSVHDSLVIDVHPDEIDDCINLIKNMNSKLIGVINDYFNLDFNVPLLLEAKIGDNWLDTKDVA